MKRWSDNPLVIGARSLLFHLASALVTTCFLLLYPLLLAPQWVVWAIMRRYITAQLWLLRGICGLRFRVIGAEHVPDGPCILASRHEAMWETMFLPLIFDNPTVLLKEEILHYPIAGPVARKLDFIGVDRSGSPHGARKTFEKARRIVATGRRLLIFPSGTRNPARRHQVQGGVTVLYRMLKLPCIPIVLDSGDYWIYGRWLRRPGQITVRVLPPIAAGLPTRAFQAQLEADLSRPA